MYLLAACDEAGHVLDQRSSSYKLMTCYSQ